MVLRQASECGALKYFEISRLDDATQTNMTRHYGMVLALPFGTAPLETYYCCPESVTLEECTSGNYVRSSPFICA